MHEILPRVRNIFTCFGFLLFSHWFVLLFFICLFSKFPPFPWDPMWVFSLLFWLASFWSLLGMLEDNWHSVMFSKPVAGQSFSGIQIRKRAHNWLWCQTKWLRKEAHILLSNTFLDEAASEIVYICGAPKSLTVQRRCCLGISLTWNLLLCLFNSRVPSWGGTRPVG